MNDNGESQKLRFETVLTWVAADRERAAELCVLFHGRLVKYFLRNHCAEPEELADITFDRVGEILLAGKTPRTNNHEAYLNRVAFHILQERHRKNRHLSQLSDDMPEPPDPQPLPGRTNERQEKELYHSCLNKCLAHLPPESQIMLFEYYSEDKTLKIDTRNRMAKRLGIASGVLRNRIWKLRNSLRDCIAECVARAEQGDRR